MQCMHKSHCELPNTARKPTTCRFFFARTTQASTSCASSATFCSRLNSATPLWAGRMAKRRTACAMPVTGCGSSHHRCRCLDPGTGCAEVCAALLRWLCGTYTKRASPTCLIYFGCNRYSVFVIAKMDKRDSIKLLPLGAWALSAPLGVV